MFRKAKFNAHKFTLILRV